MKESSLGFQTSFSLCRSRLSSERCAAACGRQRVAAYLCRSTNLLPLDIFEPVRDWFGIVNALLGAAAALAPVLLAAFVGLGIWWGLPLLACVAMLVLFAESTHLPFDVTAPDAAGRRGPVARAVRALRRIRVRLRTVRAAERLVGANLDNAPFARAGDVWLARPHPALGLRGSRTRRVRRNQQ
jgi:hypothetical protein